MNELEVHLRIEVNDPLKIGNKNTVINDLIERFKLKGAKDVTLLDSYYIMNEMPNRPKVIKIILSLKARLKDLINTFEELINLFHSYKNRPKILVYKNKKLFAEYVKNSETKGIIKKLDNENKNNFNIKIIDAEPYTLEFN